MIKKRQKKILILFLVFPLFTHATENKKGIFKNIKTYWNDNVEIWKASWNNRRDVSAITASSPWLIQEIINPILEAQKNISHGLKILEIGFGPGTVTRELVENLREKDHLDAIELIESMYKAAKENLQSKPNANLIHADFTQWLPEGVTRVEDITSEHQYDYIPTTLPFTQLPEETLPLILDRIAALLKKGGTFTYISLIGADLMSFLLRWGKEGEKYDRKMSTFAEWIEKHFYTLEEASTPSQENSVLLNISPAWVVHLVKK